MLLVMYKANRDVSSMGTGPLISYLEALCRAKESPEKAESKRSENDEAKQVAGYSESIKKSDRQKAASPKPLPEESNESKEDGNYEDDFEDKYDDKFESEAESEEKTQPQQRGEYLNVSEDQIVEIAQKAFYTLAQAMIEKKTTARELLGNKIMRARVEGEEMEVVPSQDFTDAIHSLGVHNLQPLEYACLVKILATDETEKFVKISDLVLILADYNIRDEQDNAPGKAKKTGLDFSKLDQFSMILLLALTEYLIKSDTPLYDLFGSAIYKLPVKTKTKVKNIEVMDSANFFQVLATIGIEIEENEHEELKKFLSLNANHYPDKISVKKLKDSIEQFAFNEELIRKAHECYEALMEEGNGTIVESAE